MFYYKLIFEMETLLFLSGIKPSLVKKAKEVHKLLTILFPKTQDEAAVEKLLAELTKVVSSREFQEKMAHTKLTRKALRIIRVGKNWNFYKNPTSMQDLEFKVRFLHQFFEVADKNHDFFETVDLHSELEKENRLLNKQKKDLGLTYDFIEGHTEFKRKLAYLFHGLK